MHRWYQKCIVMVWQSVERSGNLGKKNEETDMVRENQKTSVSSYQWNKVQYHRMLARKGNNQSKITTFI